jgi:hypothetical protein
LLLLLHLEMNDVWEEEGRKEGMEHRKGRNGSGGQQTKELSVCIGLYLKQKTPAAEAKKKLWLLGKS